MYFFQKNVCLDIYQQIEFISPRAAQIRMAAIQSKEVERRYGRGVLNLGGKMIKERDVALYHHLRGFVNHLDD